MEESGNTTGGKTVDLMEAEVRTHTQMMERRALKLSRVANAIEDLLLSEEMTWGEWGEVVELFSTRIGQMVAQVKVTKYK